MRLREFVLLFSVICTGILAGGLFIEVILLREVLKDFRALQRAEGVIKGGPRWQLAVFNIRRVLVDLTIVGLLFFFCLGEALIPFGSGQVQRLILSIYGLVVLVLVVLLVVGVGAAELQTRRQVLRELTKGI